MPGWTLQKYVNEPERVKRTVIGFGRSANGRPELICRVPLWMKVLPNPDCASAGVKPSPGWPVNQNGAPAASSEPGPATGAPPLISGSGWRPRAGNSAL
jgi:hypothetical protein